MSGRGIALCVIAGLAVLCAAGLAGVAAMTSRNMPLGLVMLVAGPTAACGAWALFGFAWWLADGMVP